MGRYVMAFGGWVLFVLIIAACNGGSGDGGENGDEETSDNTPPSVLPFLRPACTNGAIGSAAIAACYSLAQNWNDYVRLGNVGEVCDGTEEGGYYACIHGGEFRALQLPASVTTCTGVTVAETLGSFVWACDDRSQPLRVVSVGLRPGKYLSDLLDFSTAQFRTNAVTVSQNGSTVVSTTPAVWWGNSVVLESTSSYNLADLTGLDALGAPLTNAIYIVTAVNNADYRFSADRLALVVKPGITTVTGDSLINAMIEATARKFLWIEGSFSGEGYAAGIAWSNVLFSVLRGVRLQDGGAFGVQVAGGGDNLLADVVASTPDFSNVGVELSGTLANTLLGIMVASNHTGVRVNFGARYNRLIGITAGNNGAFDTGLVFTGTPDNLALGITAANTISDGVALLNDPDYGGADRNLLAGVAAINNGGIFQENHGLHVVTSSNATVLNLAAAHNDEYGILLDTSSDNRFAGLLKVGNNGLGDCSVTGGSNPGLTDGTCATGGTATLTTGVDASASFVGQVTTNDAANPDDVNGYADNGTITDWTHFQNPYRAWGRNGPGDLSFGDRGWYTPDGWRIWDWSLRAADTVLRNALTLPTGSQTLQHTWFVGRVASTAGCAAAVPGAVYTDTLGECRSTFLRNAVEIVGDAIGNENGLCESGEHCLYTPNIGSYQGHGARVSAGAFTGGTLTGITLWRFATNGY